MPELLDAFFAPSTGENAAGLFSCAHMCLLLVTVGIVAVALFYTRHLDFWGVCRITRFVTLGFYALELAKAAFSLGVLQTTDPNDLLPLYYCSLVLYMGPFAAHGARIGRVFFAVGALFGGVVFLLFPTTSLLRYPALHFISFHSFLWHGAMVYLALLWWWQGKYRPQKGDVWRAALPVGVLGAAALIFNTVYNSFHDPVANLMFLSKDFPGTPLSLLYRLCGRAFTPVMWLSQAFLPYALLLLGVLLVRRFQQSKGR